MSFNILMITEKDAANASLSKIADELLKRGHEVDIYAVYNSENVLRYFSKKIPVYDFCDLSKEIAENYTCIITTVVIAVSLQRGDIISAHVPIFTQNYLVDGQIYWRGDLCFVPSLESTLTDYSEYMLGGRIGIGEPKYDHPTCKIEEVSNRILFLDSGHFPFGTEGRDTLADTIIKMAKDFPTYEILVKPRFLPGDAVVTHKNALHLYDVIEQRASGAIPHNLVLLKEHKDLEELIESCHTMVCMYTTAFVGACLNKKGLVVLDGIPSVDIYDTRYKTSLRIRNHIEPSGALVAYKEVNKLLPDGVKVDDKYLKYLLTVRENSAEKIVDVVEKLISEFYSRGLFPVASDMEWTRELEWDIKEDWSWKKQVDLRYRDYLLQRMLIHLDFHVKAKLDVSKILKGYLPDTLIDFKVYQKLLKEAFVKRNECLVDNEEILMADYVDRGILLNAFFQRNMYEKINDFPDKTMATYHYFRALIEQKTGAWEACAEDLIEYDRMSYGRDYILEISDMPNNKFDAYLLLVKTLIQLGRVKEAEEYYSRLEKTYFNNYNAKFTKESCVTKEQFRKLTSLLWMKMLLSGEIYDGWKQSPLYVYGAGEICKTMLLSMNEISSNIRAIIDKYSDQNEINGIKIIRPEELEEYPKGIAVITVPEEAEKIKDEIEKASPHIKCISIIDILLNKKVEQL